MYYIDVRFKIGKKPGPARTAYFFSKRTPKRGTPCDMPQGYTIVFSKKSGMPLLKKKR